MGAGNNNFSDSSETAIFSPEERSEITARIEKASSREAVVPPSIPSKKEAQRRGLFPLLVNAGALILLAAGLFLLFSSQQTGAAEIRKSGAVLGITERALIREIRNEINEKDAAIDTMIRRIAEAGEELNRLFSLETLTNEQRGVVEKLQREQEEYQETLTQLQLERAGILTYARIKEAEAREKLETLSGDAEKAALVEMQLSGFYTGLSRQIEAGQYREAEKTLAALREFLATPSFSSIKTIQARQANDTALISTLSALIREAQKNTALSIPAAEISELPPVPPGTGAEAELRRQLTAQSASLTEQGSALTELQKNLTALQNRNDAILQSLTEKESQLDSLRATNTSQAQTIQSLQNTINSIRSAMEDQ
ncbi:MAG: hypothetical protein FWG27_03545 [Treponema sp.]|nr:hypothetical protein [Treponema sp.]